MVKVYNVQMKPHNGYKFTVLGKNNQHKPYLFNEVRDVIQGKGITTNFEIGNNKIVMNAPTKKMASMLAKSLKRAGIIKEPLNK